MMNLISNNDDYYGNRIEIASASLDFDLRGFITGLGM
jgi:hypothetical protein